MDVNSDNVHACVLDEYGDSKFTAWCIGCIGCIGIDQYSLAEKLSITEKAEITQKVQRSADQIFGAKGSTYFCYCNGACGYCECHH